MRSPAEAGVVCRHRSRRKVSRRRGLCASCNRKYLAVIDPRKAARHLARRRRRALARYEARVRACRRRLYDRRTWRRRNIALLRRYGITIFQYLEMYERQNGRCEICKRPLATPYCDHDHTTGRVRGLLCYRCNKGIGIFRDAAGSLEAAAAYVRSLFDARRDLLGAHLLDARALRRWERRGKK